MAGSLAVTSDFDWAKISMGTVFLGVDPLPSGHGGGGGGGDKKFLRWG